MNIIEIPNTQYIVLPDGTVARKLKQSLKKDKKYWYLHIGSPSKLVRFTEKEVQDSKVMAEKMQKYLVD